MNLQSAQSAAARAHPGAGDGEVPAEAAVLDWGRCLKELAAANIFPGDVLQRGEVLSFFPYPSARRLREG